MEWLAVAQSLPLGGSRKIGHDCGPGQCLVVFHNEAAWTAYCHRCGNQKPVMKPLPTLEERAAAQSRLQQAEAAMERDTRPPGPANFDVASWPKEAKLWLYKAGLTHDEIKGMGAYHHSESGRVVLPVMQEGRCIFWQARNVGKGPGAKYLSMPGGRDSAIPIYKPASQSYSNSSVTLTEDLLSAYKISTAGFTSLCLMGTSLLPHTWHHLIKEQRHVNIWLDPDSAGRGAAIEVRDKLALVGCKVRIIESSRDPKLHSKAEIRELLGGPVGDDGGVVP